MAITPLTAGAWAAGSTSIAPALPASPVAGTRMFLFVGCKPFNATINTPSGWTLIPAGSGSNGTVADGVDVGSVLWATFWRDWVSGDAAPTVSITSGNVSLGCINGFVKDAGAMWVAPESRSANDTSSDTTLDIGSFTPIALIVDDYILHGAVIAGNNATFGTPTIDATGFTFGAVTESPATEGTTATGNDLEASCSRAICASGSGDALLFAHWTLSANQTGGGSNTRIRQSFMPHVATKPLQPQQRPR